MPLWQNTSLILELPMILGAVGCEIPADLSRSTGPGVGPSSVFRVEPEIHSRPLELTVAKDASSGSWLSYSGNPIFVGSSGQSRGQPASAAQLLKALRRDGLTALGSVDGQFAIAWWDAREGKLRLIRDRFGME